MIESNLSLLSGDQSIVWDAPLKLRLLHEMGHPVVHLVHSADRFSRPKGGSTKAEVTSEAFQPDGNVNRWTATMEGAMFLGRMPLSPHLFKEAGVDFKRVAAVRGCSVAQVVEDLTTSDWLGLTLPQEGLVAHGVRVDAMLEVMTHLRRPLSSNLTQSIGDAQRREALGFFDTLFMHGAFRGQGLSLHEVSRQILTKVLSEWGVTIEMGSTVDAFHVSQGPSRFLEAYLRHEPEARAAYNLAIEGADEVMLPLTDGQLPFYAVVQNARGELIRCELDYESGDTLDDVLDRAARSGEVVSVLGKAMCLIIELRERSALVLPEHGSAYAAQASRFLKLFEEATGECIAQHPIVRLHLNALDALEDVDASIRLPPHLSEFFGQEWVEGRVVAKEWRGVVDRAQARVSALSGEPTVTLAQKLQREGRLGVIVPEQLSELDRALESYEREMRERASTAFAKVGIREEQVARKVAFAVERERLMRETDPDGLKVLRETARSLVDTRRAEALASALSATKLGYWNARPFSHWVMAVPGWYEGIRRRAQLVYDQG